MDILWIILSSICMLLGLAGCILPLLPGPPLAFVGLLILQLRSDAPFSTKFLLIWGGITMLVTILDYVVPIYSTKKFGGSKYGVWGCTVGLLLGLFIPPWGLILGPLIGAFAGEVMAHSNSKYAFKAALGSFIGFLSGTLLKLIACCMMIYYFISAIL